MTFYSLPGEEPIDAATDLVVPRARALLDAFGRHRDFELIRLARLRLDDGNTRECLVADVTCDGVPKHNPYGLQYRERVAIVVGDDRREIPSVYALRKGFPRLVHQHQAPGGSAAHLCLYFGPVAEVLRSWTPEQFLRRIQWWMIMNARGELHPADQPLDHLFFASKYELILPWNFDALSRSTSEFIVAKRDRADGGITHFLIPKQVMGPEQPSMAILVEVTLPAVLGGAVEVDPVTLGQLADLLSARNVDVLSLLTPKLRELVNQYGAPVRRDSPLTIILLHVPICREPNAEPEKTSRRAFLLMSDPLEVGRATGALIRHEGKYFTSAIELESSHPTEWRDLQIGPMEVLSENTPARARAQAGLATLGPVGVVVGAGALGSALLNLWGRSGWGQWTVIDKDHVRPHNLSRHTAIADQIGLPKVEAVAELQHAATHGANEVVAIVADASDPVQTEAATVLTTAKLVLDASASLDYPRYASGIDAYGRHAAVFITPSANAGVAMLEDALRTSRLRTLEAQYYRALIQSDWGRDHLDGNLGTFWSGASCRDISAVMPYARVLAHASTFAEQVPIMIESGDAAVRIWQRVDTRGGTDVHDLSVAAELHWSIGGMDVYFDQEGERQLRALRQQALPNETGGILLGYHDFNINALVIVAGLPAPPDSEGSPGSFERGIEGLKAKVEEVSRRTAGIVGYVGEWHSHPRGHSAMPSQDDWFQLIHLTLGMSDDGLPAVQMIIGEHDMQLLAGVTMS